MDSDLFLKYCGLRPCYMNKEYMQIVKEKGFNDFSKYYNILDKFPIVKEKPIEKSKKEDPFIMKINKSKYIHDFIKTYILVDIQRDNIEDYTSEESSSEDDELYDYISD